MPIGRKHDHPPLLAPGRHRLTIQEIWDLAVTPFGANQRRSNLWHKLEQIIQELLVQNIPCEVWLNGSFVTEKKEPDDLDVTVIIDEEVNDKLSVDQNKLIDNLRKEDYIKDVDSFVFVRFRRENPNFGVEGVDNAFDWGEQYGRESSEQWLKGFVVIKLRETDVGLRICR